MLLRALAATSAEGWEEEDEKLLLIMRGSQKLTWPSSEPVTSKPLDGIEDME